MPFDLICLPAMSLPPPNRPPPPSDNLEGVLERVTFVNEENGWGVFRVAVEGKRDLVTAVGNLLGVQPGESLRMTGHWTNSRQYGEQFDVAGYTTLRPSSLLGIERYLGSGLVKGVGKVFAKRLVEAFGEATLEVIEKNPTKLSEVEGIGPKRRERIMQAWAEQREIREVMLFLQSHGVSPAYAVKIYKRYGHKAIDTVTENPYRLARDIFGIGFKTADRIAQAIGIPTDSPRRAEAGLIHVLSEGSDDGHVFLPRDLLLSKSVQMLQIDEQILTTAITDLEEQGEIAIEGHPGTARFDEAGQRMLQLDGNSMPSDVPVRNPDTAESIALSDSASLCAPIYLRPLHIAETGIAARVHALLATKLERPPIHVERAIAWFEDKQHIELADAQRDAIRRAIDSKILVITGGPGTGKTTLVNGIIRILEKKGVRIRLAAPTGRAAKRMSETTHREAVTIHRLLEFSPKSMNFERGRDNPIDADLLILDEASMLDTTLAYSVLKALPLACQLILVGDVDQLPSVGPGAVLADFIASERVPVVRLSTIFRQAKKSLIVVNAHRINEGQFPTEGNPQKANAPRDFYFIERDEPEGCLEAIRKLVQVRLPRAFGFDPFNDIQVLTPMRRGLLGGHNLNADLQTLLNPQGRALLCGSRLLREGDKVMQLTNNYDLEVFNGDVGRVMAIDEEERMLQVSFDGRLVTYESGNLDELALAYACTIHKSQGSEYPCAVIPVHTQHFLMLQRNLLYTAVTRARKMVVLVGSKRALGIAIKTVDQNLRYTRLKQRLSLTDACISNSK
ncbi:MAG: ATP-dependent RecD-like DNA helicase [Myxococcales bacterium]|nr:ATP-dependent RecD-like DNA helicase [Myxococcales bacterium]